MPTTSVCAPFCANRVLVVGLKGDQFQFLKSWLRGHLIDVRDASPKALLQMKRFDGVVFLTRFVNHKHSIYAARIAPGRTRRVGHGAARAVADAILAYFNLNDHHQ